MDNRCAAFENGISESFNRAFLGPRHKPIITMLEEIRLYIMQRLVAMNNLAFNLEDKITLSIRKSLELLKDQQSFQELKVRKGEESYGVNLLNKACASRMWELSGVPYVHVVIGYLHLNTNLDVGGGIIVKGGSNSGGGGGNSGKGGGNIGRGGGKSNVTSNFFRHKYQLKLDEEAFRDELMKHVSG
ncbi:hypothetical protein Tco_0420970 [Tanacetum coccineum]